MAIHDVVQGYVEGDLGDLRGERALQRPQAFLPVETPVTVNQGDPINFTGTANETHTFTVSTLDDALLEGTESFTVALSASDPLVTATDTATGTITDNDAAAVPLALGPSIVVDKTAVVADGSLDAAEDVINYTIKVDNTGNVALDEKTISDQVESYTATTPAYVSGDTDDLRAAARCQVDDALDEQDETIELTLSLTGFTAAFDAQAQPNPADGE